METRKRQQVSEGCSGKPSEHAEQVTLVNWFRRQYPGVLIFAIPNGGRRDPRTAKKLKDEGVVSGIPDLCVPAWHLWIEMKKTSGGRLSSSQKEIIPYLETYKYTVIVGHGFLDAQKKVKQFVDSRGGIC